MQLSALKVCASQLESRACLFSPLPQGILDARLFGEQAKSTAPPHSRTPVRQDARLPTPV